MATWLVSMLQETGFESSSSTDTSIAQFAEVPNSAAARPAVAEATAAPEFTPAPVHDRRRRRRRRDEQGTRRRDRDRRRQEEDDAALARRLAAEGEPEDDDRDTVACRACGQRLAASVDAIEAHSLHCSAETSEAWAHATTRCRDDPEGLVGAEVEVRSRGKGVGSVQFDVYECSLFSNLDDASQFALSFNNELLLLQAGTPEDAYRWVVAIASCIFFGSPRFESLLVDCQRFFSAAPKRYDDGRLTVMETVDLLRSMDLDPTLAQVAELERELVGEGGRFGAREFSHVLPEEEAEPAPPPPPLTQEEETQQQGIAISLPKHKDASPNIAKRNNFAYPSLMSFLTHRTTGTLRKA